MRPDDNDSYSEESAESKDDSTKDGEERVASFENQPEKDQNLVKRSASVSTFPCSLEICTSFFNQVFSGETK